jgi:hypothetical protein
MDSKCAPGTEFIDGSCISVDVLKDMALAYNEEHPDNTIKLDMKMDTLHPGTFKRQLVGELGRRLTDICEEQTCWVKQKFTKRMKKAMKDELNRETFRPQGPKGKFAWLNTVNIIDVMSQYENKFSEFKFLGAVPIDFDSLPHLKIKNMNYSKFQEQGKTKLGVIFNLDEHWQPGSHWVAMYADLHDNEVYFFDSYGIRPEKRIRKLMDRISNFMGEDATVEYNEIRHQRKNTECGVYSINFIIRLLNGEKFNDITKNIVNDDKINKCRNVYFRE